MFAVVLLTWLVVPVQSGPMCVGDCSRGLQHEGGGLLGVRRESGSGKQRAMHVWEKFCWL